MSGEIQTKDWLLQQLYFQVEWIGNIFSFQEISGLETATQPIKHRHGDSPIFSRINMSGMSKSGIITMKKGIASNDRAFFDWYSKIEMNVIERHTLVIKLIDESGVPTMICTLNNAFPT